MSGFTPAAISEFLRERINTFERKGVVYEYGTVSRVSDGVVRVDGLSGRSYGELLEFDGGVYGMVMDLEENGVGAVLLDNSDTVGVGDRVRGVDRIVEIPVSDSMIGRVLDPVGRPLDGEVYESKEFLPVERSAPPLIHRHSVDVPLETGIIAIDSMVPIGRGQRELIIGDRQTGKTTIALQTIMNQKNTGVICIYCAIGQKASTVAHVIDEIRTAGADSYTFVIAACASDSPAMQYLAPYSACSAAEYFMEKGKDVLVVYDDLSKHAVAYRTMSLLLHRPPGREAYPGDIFYLHSRLLERAARLDDKYGGGSITALPIIETMSGNISSYIPTNVISITDGQIFLETELFHSGIRPAINPGISVSRVGGAAQLKPMKKVSGELKLLYSQYRELQAFAQFGSDLDADTKARLALGERIVEVLKQKRNSPVTVGCQTAIIYAVTHGKLNDIPVESVSDYEAALYELLRSEYSDLLNRFDAGQYEQADIDELNSALAKLAEKFRP